MVRNTLFADRAVIAAIFNSLDILLFRSVIRYTADYCLAGSKCPWFLAMFRNGRQSRQWITPCKIGKLTAVLDKTVNILWTTYNHIEIHAMKISVNYKKCIVEESTNASSDVSLEWFASVKSRHFIPTSPWQLSKSYNRENNLLLFLEPQ